jgi:hypothetical protein
MALMTLAPALRGVRRFCQNLTLTGAVAYHVSVRLAEPVARWVLPGHGVHV